MTQAVIDAYNAKSGVAAPAPTPHPHPTTHVAPKPAAPQQ